MKRLANILVGGLLLASTLASADPITINNAFYFRENRGVNDIGVTAGDRLVYGVNAVTPNGNDGTTATREFVALPPAANNPAVLPFNPSTDRPNQFSGSIAYTAARAASDMLLTFTNGIDTASATIDAVGTAGLMPLATNLGVTGLGTALTFHWTDPSFAAVALAGLAIERKQIFLYDLAAGGDRIFSMFLAADATSFLMPDTFSGGLSLELDHQYAFGIRIEDLRDDPTLSGGAARLSSSQTYYTFTTVPVPEPEIYAMMGMGLGLLGWFSRRRRQHSA